ncbi:MAG TPA: four helix bundle protein [Gemmatimonadaceae bacterium]|nr:four helix bundle protein [Gemmatimonadaceae bacterium]
MAYTDLIVWQRSVMLGIRVYQLTAAFPKSETYGMTAQMRKAATSIAVNIAEGYGRETTGEYLNQLSAARGSLFELQTFFIFARALKYITKAQYARFAQTMKDIERMLARLRTSLRRKR